MTIAQYLRLLREQWIAVVALTVLGALGAGAWSMLQTPTYTASAQLFVSVSSTSGSLGDLTQGSTFTQARVKSYTDLLTSPQVLAPVIEQLSLDTTPLDLGRRVEATSPLDTVLIDVTVSDTSPARAADIANAISKQFPTFVDALETPNRQTASPVKVSVTRAAVAPADPVSPRKALNLVLGLLVGLGLGVGAGVLRDSLDRSIGSRTQVAQISGAPVLGSVSDDSNVPDAPLITHDAFSPRAEAFRQLRTNIRYLSVDHRVGSLVVTGSVQSEGKTTTAANVAISLAQSGERVVLIDADLRRPSVADVFGLPGGVGLTSVLVGDVRVPGALQRWREDLPLEVMAAGPLPPNPSELIGSARMAEIIRELTDDGATVVVDSPPLLPVTDAAILARVTDGALVVARAGSTRVEQFSAAVESLRTAGATILGIVLNRVPKRVSSYGGGYGTYGGYAPSGATGGSSGGGSGGSPSGDSGGSSPATPGGPDVAAARDRVAARSGSSARAATLPAAPTVPAAGVVPAAPAAEAVRTIDVTPFDLAHRPAGIREAAGTSPYAAGPAGAPDVTRYDVTPYGADDPALHGRATYPSLPGGPFGAGASFRSGVAGSDAPERAGVPQAWPGDPGGISPDRPGGPDFEQLVSGHVDGPGAGAGSAVPGSGPAVIRSGSAVIGEPPAGAVLPPRSAYAQHLAGLPVDGYLDVRPAVNDVPHGASGSVPPGANGSVANGSVDGGAVNGAVNGSAINGSAINGRVNGVTGSAVNGTVTSTGETRRGRRSAPPRAD